MKTDFTPIGALRRLIEALDAYDDLDKTTIDELNNAETFALAVLATAEIEDQRTRELLLGGAS